MPVTKFRSIDEMPSLVNEVLSGTLASPSVRDLLATTRELAPAIFPPGVWKYRSLEDAWHERELWLETAIATRRSGRQVREG